MSDRPAHPSLDVLADHHAGLLEGDPARQTGAHLASCGQCRDRLAEIDEVAVILSEVGRGPIPMPAAVAASLDEAIGQAGAQRATSQVVVPLHAQRVSPAERSPRRAWPLLAAAAAVVVASSIGVTLVQKGSRQDNAGSGSAAETADRSDGSAELGKGDATGPSSVPGLSPDYPNASGAELDTLSVQNYAAKLADGTLKPVPVPAECATPPGAVAPSRLESFVNYSDQPAVLRLDSSARRVTVYACDVGDKVLYRHGY